VSGYRCSMLVVDDEPAIRGLLTQLLDAEFEVVTADSAEAARTILTQRPVDIILTDQQLPGQNGVQLLEHVCLHSPNTVRIMMTGLGRLEDAVDAINCGRVQYYLFKPFKNDQLLHTLRQAAHSYLLERNNTLLMEELRRLNLELEQRVQTRTGELEDANRELHSKNLMLKKMALTDSLTGLPNRRAIDRLGRKELLRRSRYPKALAIGLIDADHFGQINKDCRYLHDGGDHALKWLARTLAKAVRTVDTVGRVGGEEFMVIAPETELEGAGVISERIRATVEEGHTVYNGAVIQLTVSIGMAVAPEGVEASFDQLRHAAAAALNEAKAAGRNRSVMRVLPGTPEQIAG
jgi:diguanylate cyclase (GGDEF)-like protein